MTPLISLLIGSRDLTPHYSDLSYSNVDPGGYEQLSVTVSDSAGLKEGDEVTVRCGLATSWHGRVNEIGPRDSNGRTVTQIAALGYGAKLTDKRIQEIYADQNLGTWRPPSISWMGIRVSQGYTNVQTIVATDATEGKPAIASGVRGIWVATTAPMSEAYYDAGEVDIGSIYYEWLRDPNVSAADTQWSWGVGLATVETQTTGGTVDGSGNLRAAGPGSGTLTASVGGRRYAILQQYYGNVPGGEDNKEWSIYWRNVTVYGNHGLTKRGSDPKGFYPGDIAGHANTESGAGFELVADDSSGLIVKHSVYGEPTPHQKVIADMALLMGWHYGVWEPRTMFDRAPRLFFTAPPASPTCVIARRDIGDLDSPKIRVDRLYDTAKVKWTDPAGTAGVQTVTIANPLAASAGVTGRVLDLDMGQGDSTSAAAFGTFALQLALASARGGGSGTVPDSVTLPAGGRKPACLLRSGRDRLRVLDLPGSGSLTASDADRQDSFLVRRVETTVKNGQPTTRVEFDGGADLLEVLNARLALAAFG